MLMKLYESSAAVTLYGTETWNAVGYLWYIRALDAMVYVSSYGHLGGFYRIFRDGTAIRTKAGLTYHYQHLYWHERDTLVFADTFGSLGHSVVCEPISFVLDYMESSPLTATALGDGYSGATMYGGYYYRPYLSNTVRKHNMDGTLDSSFTVTGTQTFAHDRVFITTDGILVAIDYDNGTYGVARFYNLWTATMLYEAVFDRSSIAGVDTVNSHIWSINLTTKNMQVWSFLIAPNNFSSITMSGNRARYREDTLSVTLRGSINEPVPNWPVAWSLSTNEGRLEKSYTLTDASGVATNRYFGPGLDDFVGGSQTITVSTGY